MTEHKVGTREEWQAARDELAKLEPNAARPRYIVTDPGVGYRLRDPA